MNDTNTQPDFADSSARSGADAAARVGYCQECGKELTTESLRRIGSGIFCSPCAMYRQSTAGWQNVSNPYAGNAGATYGGSSTSPTPALAGLLGFIPGVGAMYNAQFAKGAMHLIVFVVLVALADNTNWVFWWLVWGWVFYQAFEAYHTARARRDALPLPNPFGWNDLGERMGFVRNSPSPSGAPWQAGAATQRGANGTGWAGYVPPRDPSSPLYSPFAEHPGENPYTAPYSSPIDSPTPPPPRPAAAVAYTPTYTGSTVAPATETPRLVDSTRRFPVGAAWLIGLGVLFLLGNLLPELRLSGQWFVPILLAALAFWTAFRRWDMLQTGRGIGTGCSTLPCAMTGPAMLLAISFLLTLQAAHLAPMRRSWPILLVVWGTMLLLQRIGNAGATPPPPSSPDPLAAPVRSTSGTGSLGL